MIDDRFVGPVEQLVSAKALSFHGTWWSTFTAFIMRLRGFEGKNNQSFFLMEAYRNEMQKD